MIAQRDNRAHRESETTRLAFALERALEDQQEALLQIPEVAFQVLMDLGSILHTEKMYLNKVLASVRVEGQWLTINQVDRSVAVAEVRKAVREAKAQYDFLTNTDSAFAVDHGLFSMGRQILAAAFSNLRLHDFYMGKLRAVTNELRSTLEQFDSTAKAMVIDNRAMLELRLGLNAGLLNSAKWQRAMHRKGHRYDWKSLADAVDALQRRFHVAAGEAFRISKSFESAARETNRCLNEMLALNLPLLPKAMSRFSGSKFDEEMQAEARDGMHRACLKYNPRLGVPFDRFFQKWVTQRVVAYVDRTSSMLSVNQDTMTVHRKIRAIERRYEMKGERLTTKQMSKLVGLDVTSIDSIRTARDFTVSLSSPHYEDSDEPLESCIAAEQRDIHDDLLSRDHSSVVARLMGHLPSRERHILAARHGLGRDVQTLDDLSKTYGVTPERVRQLQRAAENSLLSVAREMGLEPSALFN